MKIIFLIDCRYRHYVTLDHEGNSSNSHLYKGGAIITGRLQLSTSTDALHADNTDNMLYIDSRQYTYTAEA